MQQQKNNDYCYHYNMLLNITVGGQWIQAIGWNVLFGRTFKVTFSVIKFIISTPEHYMKCLQPRI